MISDFSIVECDIPDPQMTLAEYRRSLTPPQHRTLFLRRFEGLSGRLRRAEPRKRPKPTGSRARDGQSRSAHALERGREGSRRTGWGTVREHRRKKGLQIGLLRGYAPAVVSSSRVPLDPASRLSGPHSNRRRPIFDRLRALLPQLTVARSPYARPSAAVTKSDLLLDPGEAEHA